MLKCCPSDCSLRKINTKRKAGEKTLKQTHKSTQRQISKKRTYLNFLHRFVKYVCYKLEMSGHCLKMFPILLRKEFLTFFCTLSMEQSLHCLTLNLGDSSWIKHGTAARHGAHEPRCLNNPLGHTTDLGTAIPSTTQYLSELHHN